MAGFQCPFCMHLIAINFSTYTEKGVSSSASDEHDYHGDKLKIKFYRCPNCNKTTAKLEGIGSQMKNLRMNIMPFSDAKKYPDYVPETIRVDYEEACAIVNLSPKASATLSRRCIQGMIRDFWGIKKSRLIDEINALDECIPATQKQALHALRQIGNIGAHPDTSVNEIVDVEQADAKKLIALIEFFINGWYIERYTQEQMLNDIINLTDSH